MISGVLYFKREFKEQLMSLLDLHGQDRFYLATQVSQKNVRIGHLLRDDVLVHARSIVHHSLSFPTSSNLNVRGFKFRVSCIHRVIRMRTNLGIRNASFEEFDIGVESVVAPETLLTAVN